MINGVESWNPGMTLCYSGSSAGSHCASTTMAPQEAFYKGSSSPTWQIEMNVYGEGGDSGGPVWNPVTGSAVGIITGGPPDKTWVTPFLTIEDETRAEIPAGSAPGALNAPNMTPTLTIVKCC
jgi:hypothetical protein